MTTKSTSFRLSTSTLSLLKQISESENRSLTNMVETLIIDKAKEKGIARLQQSSLFADKLATNFLTPEAKDTK